MASRLRFSQLELIIIVLSFMSAFALGLLVAWPVSSNINEPDWAVGLVEEPVKIVGVYVLAFLFPIAFLSKKKCAIFGAAAGLGFAVFENIYYELIYLPSLEKSLISEGYSIASATDFINHLFLVRAGICAPGHVIWTAIAALGIVYVVADRSQWWKTFCFLLIAIALHGAYDGVITGLGSNLTENYTIDAAFMVLSLFVFIILYRWMPETGVPEEQVAVLIAPPNEEILVRDNKIFGRDDFEPYIPFADASQISREQFRIWQTGHQYFIEDLASSGGTRVNGVRIQPNTQVVLPQGSKITLPNETTLLFTTKGSIAASSPKTILRAPASASKTRQVESPSSRASSINAVAATTPLRAKLAGPNNAEVYITGSKEFGRDDFRRIVSDDKLPFISRRHFAIQVAGDEYSIEDLRSNNGTMVNGGRLQQGERRTLKPGDKISCGNVLELEFQPPAMTTKVGPSPSMQVSPLPSTSPKDRTAHFESVLKKMDFAMKQPLSHSINKVGNDVYNGTVARGTISASVIVETCDNIHDTQLRAEYYKNDFIARGYATFDNQAEFLSGRTSEGQAWIHVDLTELYVMAFYY